MDLFDLESFMEPFLRVEFYAFDEIPLEEWLIMLGNSVRYYLGVTPVVRFAE